MMRRVQHLKWMGIRHQVAKGTLTLVVLMFSAIAGTRWAHAQTVTTLYSFASTPDGRSPYGTLVADKLGNLYGTTFQGGTYAFGTVFRLDALGNESVLHSFGGKGGKNPWAGLLQDPAGNFYGTTWHGGAFGRGVVFKLQADGRFKVLYSFAGPDGAFPYGNVIRDATSNLYGTTAEGGAYNSGTVFKIDKTGKETVLYSFAGSDGSSPTSGLIRDTAGNLYGTTSAGGAYGHGTVFKLDAVGTETVLHSFSDVPDGALPIGGLIRDDVGNFYGTTDFGGAFDAGTVYKIDSTGNEVVLHSFADYPDGYNSYAALVRDGAGNLYGTTQQSGAWGFGIVFKLNPAGKETAYSFTNTQDGANPYAGLIRDAAGNLYGTATNGGDFGWGTVFKITP
jgi:uncharacterized repeat protein (TIGR03803 family)